MTGVSWHRGCPVPLAQLRLLTLSYVGFDGRVHTGHLVANADAAAPLVGAFRRLFDARVPIRRMEPVDAYGGSDFASIEADNTSAFNCRPVSGGSGWSQHAYGRAIDVNPIENPYVSTSGKTEHRASRPYLDRARRRGVQRARLGLGRLLERCAGLPALLRHGALSARSSTVPRASTTDDLSTATVAPESSALRISSAGMTALISTKGVRSPRARSRRSSSSPFPPGICSSLSTAA
jgi:hypothetical protein